MSTQTRFAGGLRPAFASLPPTLQPHAVLAMAPPPERRLSFLASCAVYAGLAGLLAYGAGARALPGTTVRSRPAGEGPCEVAEVRVQLRPPVPRMALPSGEVQTRPAGWTPQAVPQDPGEAIPSALPTENRFGDGLYRADMPEGDGHRVKEDSLPGLVPPVGSPATEAPVAPVELDFSQVKVLQRVDPAYPPMALRAHLQGAVVLLMSIDAQGRPTDVQVVSAHPLFQAEALRAARQWRFEPARLGERAVPAQFRLTLNFRLKG